MAIKLDIQNVHAGYGAVRALMGVSLELNQGQTVVLLGTNGNGKSTLMKCIMGMVKPESGSIQLDIDGQRHDLTQMSTEEIVNLGVALVPEGRRLFPKLTVEENLFVAERSTERHGWTLARVYALFPRLQERRNQRAGTITICGNSTIRNITANCTNKHDPASGLRQSACLYRRRKDVLFRIHQQGHNPVGYL